MEQDMLKSLWTGVVTESKDNTEIKKMIQGNNHPVLKRIRRQLIIETLAFSFLLFVYYDFFDGDRKPMYVNVLLVMSLLLLLIHNIIVYFFATRPVIGDDIRKILSDQIYRMKIHAKVLIVNRVLANVCLLFFFSSAINGGMRTFWLSFIIVLMLFVQLIVMNRMWRKRITQLNDLLTDF